MSSIHGLPRQGSMPVPYVVPWTSEVKASEYAPLKVSDGYGHRIDFHPDVAKTGAPLFANISTRRQYDTLINGLCQVCGERITDEYRWIVHPFTFMATQDGKIITADPAVCGGCLPVSLSMCPFLKTRSPRIVTAEKYDLWGAEAQLLSPTTGDVDHIVAIPYEGKEKHPQIKNPSLLVVRMLAIIPVQDVPAQPLGDWDAKLEGYYYPPLDMSRADVLD